MIDMDDDDVATEEERAEAEALARALEGQPVFKVPTDAVEAIALVRVDRLGDDVIDAHLAKVHDSLAPEFARKKQSPRTPRWAIVAGGLAAAAAVALFVQTSSRGVVDSSSSSPVANHRSRPMRAERERVAVDTSGASAEYQSPNVGAENPIQPAAAPALGDEAVREPMEPTSPPGMVATSSTSRPVPGESAAGIRAIQLDVVRGSRSLIELERAMRVERYAYFATLRRTETLSATSREWLDLVESAHRRADAASPYDAQRTLAEVDALPRLQVSRRLREIVVHDLHFRRAALFLSEGRAEDALRVSEPESAPPEELRALRRSMPTPPRPDPILDSLAANRLLAHAAALDASRRTDEARRDRFAARTLLGG